MTSPDTCDHRSIRVATVFDPFGNILGIIQNPHFQLLE
jgi:hypothetical protein